MPVLAVRRRCWPGSGRASSPLPPGWTPWPASGAAVGLSTVTG